jgi:arylsulfatase A-like enzyme
MIWFDASARRVSSWAKRLSVGAIGAWSCLACSTLVAGGPPPSAMVAVFGLGVLASCTMLMLAAAALLLSPLANADTTASEPWPFRGLGLLVLGQIAVAAALAQLLWAPAAWLVPERLAFQAEIGRIVAWHAGSALAAVGSFWLLRRRTAFPFWTWALLHLGARLLTDDELAMVAAGREHWVDLGSALFYLAVFSASDTRVRAISRLRLVLLPVAVVCALATLGSIDRSHRSRAELATTYPALASLLSLAQPLLDLDGDGFASMLGGRDCDDDNPLVDPLAMEIIGNGVDDNCAGGDLQRYTARPAARRVASLQHDVILVTVDALRSDALSFSDGPKAPMPRLRDWSRRGAAVFTRAYVAAPYTQDSLYSLLTGNYPMNMTHGGRWLGSEADLPKLLARAGYTSQIVQQIIFKETGHGSESRGTTSRGQARYRLYANFDSVDDDLVPENVHNRGVTSEQTTTRAIAHFERLRGAGRPFLLWVHYYDPHAEYMPHAGSPFPGTSVKARYWQEVWSTDKAIGRLLSHLEAAGHFERGVLALTGDHGESLGERGQYGHATCMSEHCLRTVLVLRGVSVVPGTYTARVRVFDLFPTLLELAAGIRVDRDAESLTSLWRKGPASDRDVFARTFYEGRFLRRVAIIGRWKLTEDVFAGSLSLHDLERDPGETTNLIEARPERAAALAQRMGEVWDRSMNDRILQERARSMLHELCRAGDRRACMAVQQAGKSPLER